jgi:hypothetical protein
MIKDMVGEGLFLMVHFMRDTGEKDYLLVSGEL